MSHLKVLSFRLIVAFTSILSLPSQGYCGDEDLAQEVLYTDSLYVKKAICVALGLPKNTDLTDQHYAQVTRLDLTGTPEWKLETLPPEVFKCTNLQRLEGSGNNIESVPEEIGTLRRLEFLSLSKSSFCYEKSTFITELPSSLFTIPTLADVRLCNQWITSLPGTIAGAKSLAFLSIRGTRISKIPTALNGLLDAGTLKDLNVHGALFMAPLDRLEGREKRDRTTQINMDTMAKACNAVSKLKAAMVHNENYMSSDVQSQRTTSLDSKVIASANDAVAKARTALEEAMVTLETAKITVENAKKSVEMYNANMIKSADEMSAAETEKITELRKWIDEHTKAGSRIRTTSRLQI